SSDLEQSLSGFYSFSEVLKEKGLKPKDVVLDVSVEKANHKVAQSLQIDKDEEVVVLQRLRYAHEEPIILESSYLRKDNIREASKLEEVKNTPLYELLRSEYNIHVN